MVSTCSTVILESPKVKKSSSLEKGQALLLLLLSVAVILTVILSSVSRSVTDVSLSTKEEDAQRAFSAAEAGIEQSLLTGTSASSPPGSEVSYASNINISSPGQGFKYPGALYAGESATFWLVGRTSDGRFTCTPGANCIASPQIRQLCWGVDSSYTSGEIPAVFLSVYYDWNTSQNRVGNLVSSGDFTYLKVARIGFDPNLVRREVNKFQEPDSRGPACQVGDEIFTYKVRNIHFSNDLGIPNSCRSTPGCLIAIRAMVLYNDSATSDGDPASPEEVAIELNSNLPSQGKVIESEGSAGEATRRISVFESYPEIPDLFEAAVMSRNSLEK